MKTTVGKIRDGGEMIVIFDQGAPTFWADIVTELTVAKAVVRMSFAAISINGDGIPKATVVTRLRVPQDVAADLGRKLIEVAK